MTAQELALFQQVTGAALAEVGYPVEWATPEQRHFRCNWEIRFVGPIAPDDVALRAVNLGRHAIGAEPYPIA